MCTILPSLASQFLCVPHRSLSQVQQSGRPNRQRRDLPDVDANSAASDADQEGYPPSPRLELFHAEDVEKEGCHQGP